jgi:hypothetical protein
LVGTAVNKTFVPVQIGPEGFAETETVGITTEFTDIIIVFDDTVAGLAQFALLVI